MNIKDHWNKTYRNKGEQDVSWYQLCPEMSLALIAAARIEKDAGIIDVGGGASTLVDHLLDEGYSKLAVLDLSPVALDLSRARLGSRANTVKWFEGDITTFKPPHRFGLWHDRAVFHFLTGAADRTAYIGSLRRTLQPGGGVIIATFAPEGPPKCSGLDVVRYDEKKIMAELGVEFQLLETRRETHVTPRQVEQHFIYFRMQWQPTE